MTTNMKLWNHFKKKKTWYQNHGKYSTAKNKKEQILCLRVINEIQNDKYKIIKEMPDTVVSTGASQEAEDYYDFINSTRTTEEESKDSSEESPVF